jgi:streptogramin lyase
MAGQSGSADGTASTARFNGLSGIATDSAGNLYVTDARYHVIRKITPATMVSTLAGMAPQAGTADGSGGAARFNSSIGVAADSAGNVYVADTFNETIRKVTPVGVVSTLAGAAGQTGSADGAGADARFQRPQGVATDSAGSLYVTDTYNETIRKITAAGVVTTLAGTVGQVGSTDGAAAVALFSGPTGIAADSMGNVYVADTNNHTIRKITPAGVVSTLAGTPNMPGSTDGNGAAARFHFPEGIAADSAGNVYVADTDNNTIRKITPNAVVTTVAGTVGMQGVELGPLPGSLNRPYSVAVLPGPVVKLVETDAENAVLEIVLP